MIRVRDLKKVYKTRFGENLVFEDVTFDLAMGERLGILGRNGAGKSTLVRLISGAELPTAGTIERGMSVSWPLAFSGAFQQQLTGIDNIRFISRIYEQDADRNIAFVEEFAELGPYLREPVMTYSSGMRARLAFAVSMITEFDCFLIDEISAVGDARFHDRCNQELFRKRADRAMVIISHDAGYIRDHCNRFAVLHGGRLQLFDGFEAAYSDFRQKIGLEAKRSMSPEEIPVSRRDMIEATHQLAVLDDAFRTAVQAADWSRDDGDWAAAEEGYSEALSLYPYQRSYRVQQGHMAKEQGAYDRAEIAYRTAIALGEAYDDVSEHLSFVMERQGETLAQHPAHIYAPVPAKDAAPGAPDAALFARAAWGLDALDDNTILPLLRQHATCDALLCAMVADPRFAMARAAKVEWSGSEGEVDPDAARLVAIAFNGKTSLELRQLARSVRTADDVWDELIEKGAFSDWHLTAQALAGQVEPA